METDYAGIIAGIDHADPYLMTAAGYGSGIRILRQDLWETIISFLISQQNNIKRIRKCIGLLCERYGEKKVSIKNGVAYFDFPTPGHWRVPHWRNCMPAAWDIGASTSARLRKMCIMARLTWKGFGRWTMTPQRRSS